MWRNRSLPLYVFATLVVSLFSASLTPWMIAVPPQQQAFADEELPAASLGDRKAALNFETNSRITALGENVNLRFSLLDVNQNKNIQHVTYFVEISNNDGKRVFSDVLHGHDGMIDLQFRPGDFEPYKIRANYDNYAASYISDPGNPIIVDGSIFSQEGSYKALIEVAGVDFDNLNLDQTITFEYDISVFPKQTFSANYQDQKFTFDILSPVKISATEFKPENKQLVLKTDGISANGSSFIVRADIPKEMMSGPFIASFSSGSELQIEEEPVLSGNSEITRLILLATQHEENATQNSGDSTIQQQPGDNNIVITAANVVPEFSAVYTAIIIAGVLAGSIITSRVAKTRWFG